MQLPRLKIKKGFQAHVEAIVGLEGYSTHDTDRLSYSRDANFRATIQAHYDHYENFPSVIVWPKTTEQIAQLIKAALKYKVAITPLSGASGVCGGGVSCSGGMIMDMKRMNRILRIDEERLFIDVEVGIFGLQLEKMLNRRGFTLGHFPSSILSACLGGYLAARSAGQLSSKYGKIEDMIIDLKFVDGLGRSQQTSDVSRTNGLDLTQILVGSEGTLGIITQARLKIFPLPLTQIFQAYTVPSVAIGVDLLRRIMQTGMRPAVLRLYDKLDTLLMSASGKSSFELPPNLLSGLPAIKHIKSLSLRMFFLSYRLINEAAKLSPLGCQLIIMLEGEKELTVLQHKLIRRLAYGEAKDLGDSPARLWHESRYSISYKSSKLFAAGAFTDTMEVATTWDNLIPLYEAVMAALSPLCLLLAHISHVYDEGAAIYFTFVGPLLGETRSLLRYDKIWHTALTTVQKHHGVISHHHGIGRLKKPHIRKEWGEAKQIYRQVKEFFDPHRVLNPEVLF